MENTGLKVNEFNIHVSVSTNTIMGGNLQFTRKGKAYLEMILEAWLSGSVNPHFQAYTRVIVTNSLSKGYKIIESNCAQMC